MPYLQGFTACCGASTVYQFTTPTKVALEQLDKMIVGNHMLTAILTDGQMQAWSKLLKDRDWVRVARWYNGNSGNYCNLLIKGKNDETNIPYEW